MGGRPSSPMSRAVVAAAGGLRTAGASPSGPRASAGAALASAGTVGRSAAGGAAATTNTTTTTSIMARALFPVSKEFTFFGL